MHALPNAVILVFTSMVTSVDDGLLRISITRAVSFSMTLYIACSNVTVATKGHQFHSIIIINASQLAKHACNLLLYICIY